MSSVDMARDVAVLWTLDFDAELPCESEHSQSGNEICSNKAVVVAEYTCNAAVIGCANYAAYFASVFVPGDRCAGCFKDVSECWSIRPI